MGKKKKKEKTHLSTEQVEFINTTISFLEGAFETTFSNLVGDERGTHGSICEQNRLLIYKVGDYAATQPELRSPNVDWEEFAKDFTSRIVLEGFIERLQKLLDGFDNAKSQYDFDNYIAALDDYSYATDMCYKQKAKELKKYFCRLNNAR
jgi:hypothetical protein